MKRAIVLSAALAACGPGTERADGPVVVGPAAVDHPAAAAVAEMIRAIEREDPWTFLEWVSDDFRPNRDTLRLDLQDRLDEVDSIRYLAVVDHVIIAESGRPARRREDGVVEVTFHWDREWRLVATSDLERRSGASAWTFVHDAVARRWRLLFARGDPLF